MGNEYYYYRPWHESYDVVWVCIVSYRGRRGGSDMVGISYPKVINGNSEHGVPP